MSTRRVLAANAYGNLGSLGSGSHVLMRQVGFPDTYDPRDKIHGADHDRIQSWHGYSEVDEVIRRHTGSGDMGIGYWAEKANSNEVLAFCKEILKADPDVEWTGCRVLGTVNRSNGYVVWSISVFAKHPESDTLVYSDHHAPNVNQPTVWADYDGRTFMTNSGRRRSEGL